jgi:hypothetical protein
MKLEKADRGKLQAMLAQLAGAVEELLLSGLTTASEATRQTLNVAFQEASRLRLFRLSPALRAVNEELGRYTRNEADFSRKRLNVYLNRAWLLSHGLARAMRDGDEAECDRLLWVPTNEPVDRLEVVTLGVVKIVTPASAAFEFRMRTITPAGRIPAGHRLLWANVYPHKPGTDFPPEANLAMSYKQKFTPKLLLEGRTIVIEHAAVALDQFGGGRITLGDHSNVAAGGAFTEWERFQTWDPAAALRRIEDHSHSALDLDVEMQEEVVLHDWQIGNVNERRDGEMVYSVISGPITFDALVSAGPEGAPLRKAMDGMRKKKRLPPLFGLLYYEKCRLVLRPLAVFGDQGPTQLSLSNEKVDVKAVLQKMKF